MNVLKKSKRKYKFVTMAVYYKEKEGDDWKLFTGRFGAHWGVDVFKGCDFYLSSVMREKK